MIRLISLHANYFQRKVLFTVIALFFTSALFAQTELTTAYNSTYSGRNVAFTLSKTYKKKHEFGAGIRYNIKMRTMPDDQQHIYYKRLYPSTSGQHWGAEAFYHNHILKHWEHVKPFFFYDVQVAYSTTRNVFPDGDVHRHGPFTWFEQCIGLGFKVDLPQNFFISQKLGFGGTLIFGEDEELLKEKASWGFGGLINVGIGYQFN